MRRRGTFAIRLIALAVLANSAGALAQEVQVRLAPTEIAAMGKAEPGAGTSGVAGIQSTVLSVDPTRAGPYTIEIHVPARTRTAAHDRRDDRSAVVVSGQWYLG